MIQDWQSRVWQVVALIAGLAVFALVFAYSGDDEIGTAIAGGLATALIFLIAARLQEKGDANGDA